VAAFVEAGYRLTGVRAFDAFPMTGHVETVALLAPREVPAGPTLVSVLKQELGVDPAQTLFIKDHGKREPLADERTLDVKSGMQFEALGGGSVS
jgi:hypothetical protein